MDHIRNMLIGDVMYVTQLHCHDSFGGKHKEKFSSCLLCRAKYVTFACQCEFISVVAANTVVVEVFFIILISLK